MSMIEHVRQLRPLSTALILALLEGCATISDDSGMHGVRTLSGMKGAARLVYKHTGDDNGRVNAQAGALLALELKLEAAVEIAMGEALSRPLQALALPMVRSK